MEWFIEKATEIGVDEITPIICTIVKVNFNFNRSQNNDKCNEAIQTLFLQNLINYYSKRFFKFSK